MIARARIQTRLLVLEWDRMFAQKHQEHMDRTCPSGLEARSYARSALTPLGKTVADATGPVAYRTNRSTLPLLCATTSHSSDWCCVNACWQQSNTRPRRGDTRPEQLFFAEVLPFENNAFLSDFLYLFDPYNSYSSWAVYTRVVLKIWADINSEFTKAISFKGTSIAINMCLHHLCFI